MQARCGVLADGEVGHAPQADRAVRPGLLAGPFDGVPECLGAGDPPGGESARALPGAGHVDADDGVSVGDPGGGVDRFVIFELEAGGVAEEVVLFFLLVVLEVGVRSDGVVVERLAVGAAADDDRVVAGLGRAEHVGEHVGSVPEGDDDVAEAEDAHRVPAKLIAGVRRAAEIPRRVAGEDAGAVEFLEEFKDDGIVGEVLNLVGHVGAGVVGVMPEVDSSVADDVVDLGGDVGAVVPDPVAAEGEDESRDVGQAGILQLARVSVDAGDDLREVHPRLCRRMADGRVSDQERDALAGFVLELPALIRQAMNGGGLVPQAGNRTGQHTSERHRVSSRSRTSRARLRCIPW